MDAAFAEIKFNEAGAAEANLAILRTRLSPKLWERLPTLLAQAPSPDDALNFLERYLCDAPASVTRHLEKHPAALHYLLSLFSFSRFLSESLVQQPELILWLDRRGANEGLERRKSRDDVLEDCYRFSTMAYDSPPAVFLARFKRREYLRITLRDVLNLATLAETTLELSDLADALIERALRLCAQRLENQYGAPQWQDATGHWQRARLTVLSLGKLGGQELNYSSDIDLIFLYDQDGETAGGTLSGSSGTISNLEYFVRLAQAILKLLTEPTPEGAAFRVDLRLRPEGQQGDIATSLASALDYYRTRAREWELQMLIKARVSAGEIPTGERFLGEVHPLIYRPEFHLAAVEAVANAREGISRALQSGTSPQDDYSAEWNVKLSPGGIRDIEFLTQCLQRIHGGRDAWLTTRRSGSTLVALQRLHDKGYLTQRDFHLLGAAYQFLRTVEHRLQLRDGLQEHTLPRKAGALERLALRCGIEASSQASAGEELLRQTRRHFEEVRTIYERVLPANKNAETDWPARAEQEAGRFAGRGDSLMAHLKADHPALAERLAHYRCCEGTFTRRGAEKFLDAALEAPALLRQLEEHPAWMDFAARLFALSDFAAEALIREPRAIRQLASAGDAAATLRLPFQATLGSLRVMHRMSTLRAATKAILGETKPFETFAELTRTAETALRGGLALAGEVKTVASSERRVARQNDSTETVATTTAGEEATQGEMGKATNGVLENDAPFVVIALGRLGTGEFDIGSDADLVFLADATVKENELAEWRRTAERFLRVAGSYTSEGLLLPVDTRLRPRGGEGEIVQSAESLLDYFVRDAEGWEAATYLKARPVAGNLALGERVIGELYDILRRRYCAAYGGDARELARQLVHTRERLERERAEGATGFKCAAGGFFDIEYVIAYAALAHGEFAEMPKSVIEQIDALQAAGALKNSDADLLRDAATFYRSLDHAIRLVLGRSSSTLPEPAQLPRVNSLLRQWGVRVAGSLHDALASTQSAVRKVYSTSVRNDRA